VTDSSEDRTFNGTFPHGETVRTICKKEGREVVSDTSVGEKPRKSSTWIRIEGTPGIIQFAPPDIRQDVEGGSRVIANLSRLRRSVNQQIPQAVTILAAFQPPFHPIDQPFSLPRHLPPDHCTALGEFRYATREVPMTPRFKLPSDKTIDI
jgi:hypothetical protein